MLYNLGTVNSNYIDGGRGRMAGIGHGPFKKKTWSLGLLNKNHIMNNHPNGWILATGNQDTTWRPAVGHKRNRSVQVLGYTLKGRMGPGSESCKVQLWLRTYLCFPHSIFLLFFCLDIIQALCLLNLWSSFMYSLGNSFSSINYNGSSI
jgi:hypothetical protein